MRRQDPPAAAQRLGVGRVLRSQSLSLSLSLSLYFDWLPKKKQQKTAGLRFHRFCRGQDITFGEKFSREFVDAREEPTEAEGLMNLHNNEAGRRVKTKKPKQKKTTKPNHRHRMLDSVWIGGGGAFDRAVRLVCLSVRLTLFGLGLLLQTQFGFGVWK